MSGFLNIFKNLFSGIFGFLGGLLGGKSKDGFYLELKEESDTAPAVKAAPVVKAEPVAAPVVAAAPVAPAAPANSKSAAKVSKAKSTRAEKLAALAAEGAGEAKSSATPAAVATALNLPQPIVTQQAPKEPAIKTFADTYLLPLATPNRRPGANMSSFLDMARQVKKA